MTTPDPLTESLKQIAWLKAKLAPLEEELAPLKEELDEERFHLLTLMKEAKSKRTEAVDGYYAVRTERKSYVVNDASAIQQWLSDQGLLPDEYLKLDMDLVKTAAKEAMKENGELIKGLDLLITESITVKEQA